jgi:hypothetical protein
MHVDNSVAFGGVEADMQACGQALDLEHGAAARARRHDKGRQNFGRDTGFHQGVLDDRALARGVIGRRQMLQRAAAAFTVMTARLVQANFPAAR